MKDRTTFTSYACSPIKEVQYLSLENFKTNNERKIFEIYDYYVGVLNTTQDNELREFANNTRNEAAQILSSRLEGDSLLALQAKFLAKFFPYYKICEEKIPTNFDEYLKGVYLKVKGEGAIIAHKIDILGTGFVASTLTERVTAKEIIGNCKVFHEWILQGKVGKGSFSQ